MYLIVIVFYRGSKQQQEVIEEEPNKIDENSCIELSNIEKESAKTNFLFYDKAKLGYVERFELPMVLSGK